MNVWLVWQGEWEAVLISVHATQAGAEKAANELRTPEADVIRVEEHEVLA